MGDGLAEYLPPVQPLVAQVDGIKFRSQVIHATAPLSLNIFLQHLLAIIALHI